MSTVFFTIGAFSALVSVVLRMLTHPGEPARLAANITLFFALFIMIAS